MPLKKFIEAAKNDTAIQNELTSSVNASIINVAKKHGYEITNSDLDQQKQHKASGALFCVSTTKTVVCTV